ncbi:YbaN family protein, partial [Pseudomonas viridiflava]|uniref:YbaN family protein n=1 Tax=Pseudomonas viridiflava TaxID=33069 RepID=UPI0013E0DD9E
MTGKTPSTSKIARILFGLLAYVSLGIGLVAIVIPGLPTTEFILLAAWAATNSSPRLSAWLENHRLFGPIL